MPALTRYEIEVKLYISEVTKLLREFIDQLDKLPQKSLSVGFSIDKNKPLIAVICAASGLFDSAESVERTASKVCDGIIAAGGTPKRVYLPSVGCSTVCGTEAAKYELPSRDIVADCVELVCSAEFFDGVVFVSPDENATCGMLLGAIRMNLPCMFVSVGVMSPIVFEGKQRGFDLLYEQAGLIKLGKTTYDKLYELERSYPLVDGTDCDSYDANSFNCVLELFGLAVQGNGTAPAGTFERDGVAFQTGKSVVTLALQKCTPRRLITTTSVNNAVILDLACGGSATTILNLIAISKSLALKNVTLKSIGEIAKTAKKLVVKKDATVAFIPQFHKAGGVYGVLKNLYEAGRLNADCQFDAEKTLAQMLADVKLPDCSVITAWDEEQSPDCELKVLYGNLAEGGCVARFPNGKTQFEGKAKVYESETLAIEAILHREINAVDVVIIRGEGPKSAPGMRKILYSSAILRGIGLDQAAVITDGRISDVFSGVAVGSVTPESSEQCLFAVLRDGDQIEINAKGKISCDVKAKELAQRLRNMDSPIGNYANSYLKNWAKHCSTASDGCAPKGKK